MNLEYLRSKVQQELMNIVNSTELNEKTKRDSALLWSGKLLALSDIVSELGAPTKRGGIQIRSLNMNTKKDPCFFN